MGAGECPSGRVPGLDPEPPRIMAPRPWSLPVASLRGGHPYPEPPPTWSPWRSGSSSHHHHCHRASPSCCWAWQHMPLIRRGHRGRQGAPQGPQRGRANLSKTEKMVSGGRARWRRRGGERGARHALRVHVRAWHTHTRAVHISFPSQGGGWTQGLKPGSLGVDCQPRGNPAGGDV